MNTPSYRLFLRRAATLFAAFVSIATTATGSTYYVSPSGDNSDGWSPPSGFREIQTAIDAASDGDAIHVFAGTYAPITSYNKAITIQGYDGAEATFIDGNNSARCADLGGVPADPDGMPTQTNTILIGFTLLNGRIDTNGAADRGAGVRGGTLYHCVISNNVAAYAGGGAAYSVFNNCTLTGNTAAYGGGATQSIFNRCRVERNTATTAGGGAHWSLLHNSLVVSNSAPTAGGVNGGAAGVGSLLVNCTVYGNTAGGGVFGGTVHNSILWSNTPADYAGDPLMAYSCAAGAAGDGNIAADPQFADAANGDFRLYKDSPCLNAGSDALAVLDTDIFDYPQIDAEGYINMGAVAGFAPIADGYWVDHRDTAWQFSRTAGATNTIGTAEELAQFAYLVNNIYDHQFRDVTIVITNSIDLSAHYWTPIGDSFDPFSGTLTATEGVVISGLTVVSDDYYDGAGFLGNMRNCAKAIGLTLTGVNITGPGRVGGIVGYAEFGCIIADCTVSGTLTGTGERTGGIVGENWGGIVVNCVFADGIVSGTTQVGGIVGRNDSFEPSHATVANCDSRATFVVGGQYVGGVVGFSNGGTVINCIFGSAPRGSTAAGNVYGLYGNTEPCTILGNGTITLSNSYWNVLDGANNGLNASGSWRPCSVGTFNGTTEAFRLTPAYHSDGILIADNLIDALNLYVRDNPTVTAYNVLDYGAPTGTIALRSWTFDESDGTLGYPVFALDSEANSSDVWLDWVNHEPWSPSFAVGATNYIATAGQLARLARLLNLGYSFAGTVNIITADLDLSAHEWVPAGSADNPFLGTLCSVGPASQLINGLTITNTLDDVGLFSYLGAGASVSGIVFTNVNIDVAGIRAGTVAGSTEGAISGCEVYGSITGNIIVGGIAGTKVGDTSIIVDCANYGTVSGADNIGGIVGYHLQGTVTRCANHGAVTGSKDYAGGIAGFTFWSTTSDCANYGAVSGSNIVGGISGHVYYNGAVNNSFNRGTVRGITPGHTGGIAGQIDGGTVANCLSLGPVTRAQGNGGIAGQNTGAISNSYWQATLTEQAYPCNIGTGTGITAHTAGFNYTSGQLTPYNPHSLPIAPILLDALNAWLADQGATHLRWTLVGSPDGYPTFPTYWHDYRDANWSYTPGATNDITTAAQFAQFAWLADAGASFVGTTLRITAPLDFSAHDWIPAFTDTAPNTRFIGTLTALPDCPIDGLVINTPDRNYTGLFACNYGTLDNLTFTNADITGAYFTGAIAGLNYGAITRATVHGTVTGAECTGALVGDNRGFITHATVHGTVKGVKYTGGIAGRTYYYNHYRYVIANCVSHATVTGYDYTGGIVGFSYGIIANCVSHATVTGTGYDTGGIAGANSETLVNCVSHATVNGADGAGGIAGSNGQPLLNCVSHATVTGNSSSTGAISGYNGSTIANAYWNAATAPANAVGYGGGTAECRSFDDAPGTFSESITIADTTTTNLLQALNLYVSTNFFAVALSDWTLATSPHGYPILADFVPRITLDPWSDISAANPGLDLPPLILPRGGSYDQARRAVYDSADRPVYFPGQRGVLLTGITLTHSGSTVLLTHALTNAPPVLLGKPHLTDPAWTYLNEHHAVTLDPPTALIPTNAPFLFFTARE